MSHEPNDATCLRNQLAQLREQLAKAEGEAKRYREAWASVRKQWDNEATIAAGWNVPSGDRLASLLRQCIDDMDDLIPPEVNEIKLPDPGRAYKAVIARSRQINEEASDAE